MESIFNSFLERIQLGRQNNIPYESRLIILGEIIYATERQDLTPSQARELEEMLNLTEKVLNYPLVKEQAIFGEIIS